MFVGFVRLTSNHIIWFGTFLGKITLVIFENLKLSSFYSGNYKLFKNALAQFIPNRPPKHVVISTNSMIKYDLILIAIFFVNKDFIDYSKQASLHKIQRMIMIDSNNYPPRQH